MQRLLRLGVDKRGKEAYHRPIISKGAEDFPAEGGLRRLWHFERSVRVWEKRRS